MSEAWSTHLRSPDHRHRATQVLAAGLVLTALLTVPAPLLPPHALAEAMQSLLGIGWKAAYLVAAIGLQSAFYGSLGLLATFALRRASTARGRLLQAVLLPLAVVGTAVLVRSVKAGHLPVWTNALAPVVACLIGVSLGLGLRHRNWKGTMLLSVVAMGATLWCWRAPPPSTLRQATEARLRRLVAVDSPPSTGDARFALLLRTAFTSEPTASGGASAVNDNRAAILALGIVIGDPRLARQVGLERDTALVRHAMLAGTGASLRGREDWAKHYVVSAALAVLEQPFVSEAAGLMKEQLDALTHDSGFSFGDIAADRAGVRFAEAATRSDATARSMQVRLQPGFTESDYFPSTAGLPEALTVEQFRHAYGGVGSPRYRQVIAEIDARLDKCAGLAASRDGHGD